MAEPNAIQFSFDAFIPAEMAQRAERVGVQKTRMGLWTTFVLAVLAGAFIALGAVFSTTATAGVADRLPYGVSRLLAGFTFSLGLILVIVAGAELFTGNTLIIMAWADGKISTRDVLGNWTIVYFGNFVGSLATAALMFVTKQYTFGNGAVGLNALAIANNKTGLGFVQVIALGIMCNALVCLAVWLCFSARTTTDKILSIIPPITAFVAASFEHSIANMYFIPIALFIKQWGDPAFFQAIGKAAADFSHLTWFNFLVMNLLPATIGNIIGGAGMVGIVYWSVYLRPRRMVEEAGRAAVQPAVSTPTS